MLTMYVMLGGILAGHAQCGGKSLFCGMSSSTAIHKIIALEEYQGVETGGGSPWVASLVHMTLCTLDLPTHSASEREGKTVQVVYRGNVTSTAKLKEYM